MNFFPQPCEFPRVSGHLLHHGMTNQNGQGQVLRGQAPSESVRLGAKQGHAKSAKASKHDRFSAFSFLKFRIPHFAFPNQIPLFRLYPDSVGAWRPLRESSAFSLTEVVIAMGVAAVAFTSIIALFPLGLNMSKDSYDETQAALIAQTVLADIQDEASGSGVNGHSRFIQIGGNSDPASEDNYLPVYFMVNVPFTFYLAYSQIPRDSNDTDPNSKPIMMRPTRYSKDPADFYNSGGNGLSAVVKVTAAPCFRINGTGAQSNPMRIDVSVETPGNVSNTNRSQFLFTGATPPG